MHLALIHRRTSQAKSLVIQLRKPKLWLNKSEVEGNSMTRHGHEVSNVPHCLRGTLQ